MSQPESSNGHGPLVPGATPASAPPPRRATLWQKILTTLVVGYAVMIVVLWAWMFWEGDREWLATLLLFGPRWVLATPLPPLALAAAIWYRRLLVVLAVTAAILFGPFMGLRLHLPAADSEVPSLRVMTCNVYQNRLNKEAIAQLIVDRQPDIVALQEVRGAEQLVWPEGWHVSDHDEFLLASRWPVAEVQHLRRSIFPFDIAAICYRVQLPDRAIQVFNVHLRSPRQGVEAVLNSKGERGVPAFNAVLEARANESQYVSDWVARHFGEKIVMGDFNMPGESTLFRRDWSSLDDAFASAGWGYGFTKQSDELGFTFGARIDHILYSPEWTCLGVWVGPDVGSDHFPLFAEFE